MYQKFQATQIFTGTELLEDQLVLITTKDGAIEAIVGIEDAGDDIQSFDGIITPGLVNAHCHLELSHLKQVVPKHTGLVTFLSSISLQRAHSTLEERKLAMQVAHDFLIAKGTVAIGDISNNDDSLSLKQQSPIAIHTFIECLGFAAPFAEARFQYSTAIEATFKKSNLSCSITPHAPYSFSKELLSLINENEAGKDDGEYEL
jgi:cytosine/adenosine deaminase-related metal-dependent hydrolase